MKALFRLNEEKVPKKKVKHVGIEIEFISEMQDQEICDLLLTYKLHNHCNLGEDGSIETDDEMENKDEYGNYYSDEKGYELRVLCTEAELVSIMTKVGSVLRRCGAKVNESCGLHIHLDMRSRDPVEAFKLLLNKQDQMFNMVSMDRQDNSYCERVSLDEEEIPQALKGEYIRRQAINPNSYSKHKTIEVRLHEGTTNTREIINWCKYLISIIDKKVFTKGVAAYAKERIKACRVKTS